VTDNREGKEDSMSDLRPFVFDAVVNAWMEGHAAVTTAVLDAVPTGWIRTLDGWEWLDLDALVDEAIRDLLERRRAGRVL
jgi:hypothetical protein